MLIPNLHNYQCYYMVSLQRSQIPKEEKDLVKYASMVIPAYISYQWYCMFPLQRTGTHLVNLYVSQS
jgi:hypothetical protein